MVCKFLPQRHKVRLLEKILSVLNKGGHICYSGYVLLFFEKIASREDVLATSLSIKLVFLIVNMLKMSRKIYR